MKVVGIDIGGANLKAADSDGQAFAFPFAIWQSPEQLPQQLTQLLSHFQEYDLLAITMTAELADCFETKPAGVNFILNAVEEVADGKPVAVWQTGAEFVMSDVARSIPYLVAAANWHVLATWIGRLAPEGNALLIDVGSTTTDIIPLLNGVPVPAGLTDRERLQSGELVYSGVRRTPVCAVAKYVPLEDGQCRLAAELFATMHDVYLLLEKIVEDEEEQSNTDGRPATVAYAHKRLARMCCCDALELTRTEAIEMSQFLMDEQVGQLQAALNSVCSRMQGGCQSLLVSGSGSFLAEQIIAEHETLSSLPVIDVSAMFSQALAESACAFALAQLAVERL